MIERALLPLAKILTPPGNNPDALAVWRLLMAGTLIALLFSTAVHIAWACGLLGDSGFAHAADVNAVRTHQLEEELDKWYTTLCMEPGNQAVLALIREIQDEYREINGEDYTPPSCDLLIKLRE